MRTRCDGFGHTSKGKRNEMKNYNAPTRFEKEMTDEPGEVGEWAPAMGTDTSSWDHLKDVLFRGDKSIEEVEQQEEESEMEM